MTEVPLPDLALQRAAETFLARSAADPGMPALKLHLLILPMGGGPDPIEPDQVFRIPVAWTGQLVHWVLVADDAGDLQLQIDLATYDSYPSVTTVASDTAGPSLSGAIKNESPEQWLPGWNPYVHDGDWLIVTTVGTPTVTGATLGLRLRED